MSDTLDEHYVREQAHGDTQFALWLLRVDERISATLHGLGHRDIADWTWWDAYINGYEPQEAADEALEEEGI